MLTVRNVHFLAQTLDHLFGHKDAVLRHHLHQLFIAVWIIGMLLFDQLLKLFADRLHARLLWIVFSCQEELHRVDTERRLQVFIFQRCRNDLLLHSQRICQLLNRQQLHIARAIAEEWLLHLNQRFGDLHQCVSTEIYFFLQCSCIGHFCFQILPLLTVIRSLSTTKHVLVFLVNFNLREGKIVECNVIFVDKFNHHHIGQDVRRTAVAAVLGTWLWIELTDAQHRLFNLPLCFARFLHHLQNVHTSGQVHFLQQCLCQLVLFIQLHTQTFLQAGCTNTQRFQRMDDCQRFFKFGFTVSLFDQILFLCQQVAVFIQTADQILRRTANPRVQLLFCQLSAQMIPQRLALSGVEQRIVRLVHLRQLGLLVKVAQTFLKVVGLQPGCLAGAQVLIGIAGQVFFDFDDRIFQHHLIEVLIEPLCIHLQYFQLSCTDSFFVSIHLLFTSDCCLTTPHLITKGAISSIYLHLL